MKKKRLLGILLSITLILGLTPGVCLTARADGPTNYHLRVGDTQVTSSTNLADVLGDGKVSFTPATDSSPAILALSGASITYDSVYDPAIYYDEEATADLIIELSGNNTVSNSKGQGITIKSHNDTISHNVIIRGNGTISINTENVGIFTNYYNLTIDGETTMNARIESTYNAGIDTRYGNLTINGGIVNVICDLNGIDVYNGDLTITGGNVTATGHGLYGIDASYSNMTITGGNVTATGQTYGIYCNQAPTEITGGEVHTTATDASGNAFFSFSAITINGGKVYATNSKIGILSFKTITIEDGELYAIDNSQYGLSASDTVSINGGIAIASGNEKAIDCSTVINLIAGAGWDNSSDLGGGTTIDVNNIGRPLDYRRVQFPSPPPAIITEDPEAKDLTYNGTAQELVTAGRAENGTMQYALGTATEATEAYTGSIPTGINAGDYFVWYKAKGDTGYVSTTPACITVTIKNKPTPTPSPTPIPVKPTAYVKTAPVANTLTYDGEPQELVTAGEATGGTMQYALGKSKSSMPTSGWSTSIPTGTDAGTYYVWYKAKGDRYHTDSYPKCVTATIKKVPSSVTSVPMVETLIYNGEPQELITAGEADGGTMQYAIATDSTTAPKNGWSTEVPTGTDAGSYFVWCKVVGDNNHEDIEPLYAGVAIIIENHSDNVLSIDVEKGVATVKDDVSGSTEEVPLEIIKEGLVYRMYDPNRGAHFFTKLLAEVEILLEWGWLHESDSDFTVVNATDEDAVPVYRLYNPNFGGMHYYTDNAEDAKYLASVGWNYEGISHYVYRASSTKGSPQHRLYNPNSPNGEHIWLSDESGINMLIDAGWIYEGVCWRIAFD